MRSEHSNTFIQILFIALENQFSLDISEDRTLQNRSITCKSNSYIKNIPTAFKLSDFTAATKKKSQLSLC